MRVTDKSTVKNLDDFLHTITASAPSISEVFTEKGSYDVGDPTTTNLYVGHLAPTVTEESLQSLFGKYGAINSIKVMWPRTEEERLRKRNCGFVSFIHRADAEDAMVMGAANRRCDIDVVVVIGKY